MQFGTLSCDAELCASINIAACESYIKAPGTAAEAAHLELPLRPQQAMQHAFQSFYRCSLPDLWARRAASDECVCCWTGCKLLPCEVQRCIAASDKPALNSAIDAASGHEEDLPGVGGVAGLLRALQGMRTLAACLNTGSADLTRLRSVVAESDPSKLNPAWS